MKSKTGMVAAVTAAVLSYLAQEAPAPVVLPRRAPAIMPSAWVNFGREEIMRMRTLWQRRIVSKW